MGGGDSSEWESRKRQGMGKEERTTVGEEAAGSGGGEEVAGRIRTLASEFDYHIDLGSFALLNL